MKLGERPGDRAPRRLPAHRPRCRGPRGADGDLALSGSSRGRRRALDLDEPFVIVSQHPVTTEYGEGEEQITRRSRRCVSRLPAIVLWPNADAGSEDIARGMRKLREHRRRRGLHFFKNLPTDDYIELMRERLVPRRQLDSAIREGAFIGTPAVNIGTRQEGRDRGSNVIDVANDAPASPGASSARSSTAATTSEPIYGDGNAGAQIADILATVERDDPEAHHLLMTVLGLIPRAGDRRGSPARTSLPSPAGPCSLGRAPRQQGAPRLDRVVCSTDSDEIAAAAARLRRRGAVSPACGARGGRDADAGRRPRRARTIRRRLGRRGPAAHVAAAHRSAHRRSGRAARGDGRRLGRECRRGSTCVHAGLGAAAGGRPVAAVRGWAACDPPSGQADALRAQRAGRAGRAGQRRRGRLAVRRRLSGPIRCRSWNRSTSTTQTTSRSSTF